jgi:hypothetical protein
VEEQGRRLGPAFHGARFHPGVEGVAGLGVHAEHEDLVAGRLPEFLDALLEIGGDADHLDARAIALVAAGGGHGAGDVDLDAEFLELGLGALEDRGEARSFGFDGASPYELQITYYILRESSQENSRRGIGFPRIIRIAIPPSPVRTREGACGQAGAKLPQSTASRRSREG